MDDRPGALPHGLLVRAPSMADMEAVNELIRACELADDGEAESTTDDVLADWRLSSFDLSRDAWAVVTPDGGIAGYAKVWGRGEYVRFEAMGFVHPDYCRRGVGARLLALMEARVRVRLPLAPAGATPTLNIIVSHANEAARRLLEEAGYTPARYYWRMVLRMEEPPPSPQWPDGITVRTFVRGRDGREVYALVQEAFADNEGFAPLPFDDWAGFMTERESFDPALFFLAVEGEQIAGVALCPYYPEQGWVRQLAVRRGWRRRGLGRALLRHVFAEFYQRRQRSVGLVVDSYNRTAAREFYEAVGMHVERQHDSYRKRMK